MCPQFLQSNSCRFQSDKVPIETCRPCKKPLLARIHNFAPGAQTERYILSLPDPSILRACPDQAAARLKAYAAFYTENSRHLQTRRNYFDTPNQTLPGHPYIIGLGSSANIYTLKMNLEIAKKNLLRYLPLLSGIGNLDKAMPCLCYSKLAIRR